MKKLLSTLFLFVLLVSTAMAGYFERSEPYLVKFFKPKAAGLLEVSNPEGNISVIGTDSKNASVALLVTDLEGNYHKATIQKALENYTIDIREENNTIFASAVRKPDTKGKELLISFRVNIPKKTVCNLYASSGSITLNNIKANSKARTTGGAISLCQFAGALQAESNGGAISLNEAEGSLKLLSSGGSINLKKVGGDIDARSEGGSILADVRELGKFLILETNDGSLQATIPGNRGINLDLAGKLVRSEAENFSGISEAGKIVGTINGGGVPVKLHTLSGQAELRYKL